tara:strand:- start:64366 stop:66204 length:1839 start_codon:yes stop_codon:yes gene_type:complete
MGIDTAKRYVKAGLNPVPLQKGGKIPIRKNWGSPINKEVDDFEFEEIGICTGAVSGGLEGIDFDLKYSDNPDNLWNTWKSKVPHEILEKLTVSTTKNDGYHVLYRTDVSEGNKKLAKNSDKEVLIETRAEGGYLKCYPSDGYTIIYGDLEKINKITDYERAILMSTSILFDETLVKEKKYYSDEKEYKDPFPDYNSDPKTGIDLLEKHGWVIERESNIWVEFTRPGKTSGVSAGYNLEGNFFYVHTTSTDFESEKLYANSAIFCMLEEDGNFKKGYRKLSDMGFGSSATISPEKMVDDLSFLSRDGEDEEKLEQAIDGTIPIGISYGWSKLDEYLVWKDNTLNFLLSFEGVGKTYMTLHQLVALAVVHGKKFALSCGENEVYEVKQFLIEAASGKKISHFKGNLSELRKYKDFVNAHFFIIRNDTHYTVEQILERAEKLKELYDITAIFIDPFSYYKKDPTNQYAYVDNLLSVLNLFSKTVCAVIMSLHPVTEATRAPKDKEGYPQCPSRYDAVFGNMWSNRSDSFVVYHRVPNHRVPAMRRIMEVRVEKVKNIGTGGHVSPVDESMSLTYKEVDGFTGYFDTDGNNPMYNALNRGKEVKELPRELPNVDIF